MLKLTSSLERCPECRSFKTLRRKGVKQRLLRMIPIGSRQTFLVLRIWRIRCEDCGALRWPRLPFVKGKARHTRRFRGFRLGSPSLDDHFGCSDPFVCGLGFDQRHP
ncbi:MAG: transposase family protein [Deltaproteobacteria bacterium]|nr:transposase family protein [Deltaproteobacteria bacterium]